MACFAHLIDSRIVDDLIGNIQLLTRICSACLISHLNSSLNAPAVAVRLCKLDSQALVLPSVAIFSHLCHQASGGVAYSVGLHQCQAVFVINWVTNISTSLAKTTPKGSAIEAHFFRHAFCFAGSFVQ